MICKIVLWFHFWCITNYHVLFWQDSTWVKKEGDKDFDIPMGCYGDAEICKLVRIYMQNKVWRLMNKIYSSTEMMSPKNNALVSENAGGEKNLHPGDRKKKSI